MDFWNSAYSFFSTNCSIGGQWIVHNAVIFLSYTGVSADADMDNHPSYLESLVWPNEVIFSLIYANDEVVQPLNNCWKITSCFINIFTQTSQNAWKHFHNAIKFLLNIWGRVFQIASGGGEILPSCRGWEISLRDFFIRAGYWARGNFEHLILTS